MISLIYWGGIVWDGSEMRVLIACDKFKGSLTAVEACDAVKAGLPQSWAGEICPVADGGEGFVESMLRAGGGEWVKLSCQDALGRQVAAEYGMMGRVAVIEMASASGMWRISPERRDVRGASTFGTGEMMRHALEVSGAEELLVGIGGSASNDGGAGMAAALGLDFWDAADRKLAACPRDLSGLARLDDTGLIALPALRVACDVDNPLLGVRGASAVFGPQKGATAEDVDFLEMVLGRLVEVSGFDELARRPGAGAAGGLGFGMMAWAGARLESGFEMVSQALDLEARIRQVDLVVTGEGSLDEQTLAGKGPAGVAELARKIGVPVVGVGGRVEGELGGLFDRLLSLEDCGVGLEESMRRAAELVEMQVRREFAEGWA